VAILVEATGHSPEQCAAVLADAHGDVKVALVALLTDVPVATAKTALHRSGGIVRAALIEDPVS
jgi:N-acetylmuramic acid 6-phosphate etherase